MMLVVSTEMMLITTVLGGYLGWIYRSDRGLLRRNWSHVLGISFLYYVLFYSWLFYVNGIPIILSKDSMLVVLQLVLLVGGIGCVIGFLLQRYVSRKNGRK